MKINILLAGLCLVLLVGCGRTVKPLDPVSIAPITVIGDNVKKAREHNAQVTKAATAKDLQAVIANATQVEAVLQVAQKQIENYKQEIVSKNEEIKTHNEQVANLQINRDSYKSAMWKRNWIIVGMASGYVLIILLFIFKQALRNNPWTGWLVRILLG